MYIGLRGGGYIVTMRSNAPNASTFSGLAGSWHLTSGTNCYGSVAFQRDARHLAETLIQYVNSTAIKSSVNKH